MWALVLLSYLISPILAEPSQTQGLTAVDIVISGLKEQAWTDDDQPCLEQTLFILDNVRNYTAWAVWVWNSMHSPVGTFYGSEYSLGNYDQCLNAPTTAADPGLVTQYCLADITLTEKEYGKKHHDVLGSTEPYLATRTPIGRNLNRVIWGTCLPSTCKPDTISKILRVMYQINPLTPSVPRITVDTCEAADKTTEYSFGFYAFMTLTTLLVATSVISTYYIQRSDTKTSFHTIAYAFSLQRNWSALTRKTNDDIGILNLLKVGLVTLAVTTHTAFFEVMGPISNGLHFDDVMLETKNPLLNMVKHIDLPVDNFLILSGMFLVQGLMAKNKKPLVGLVNRYFRLTASYAVVIFYVASVAIYTGAGPFWQKFAGREQQACVENWWLNLLMLNNYINSDNICLIVSWYIPCDYQLAVMGTMLYLLYQNKILGKKTAVLTVLVAVMIPGVVTYWKKLPGFLLYHNLETMLDIRKNDVYVETYIRSHNRAGPYFVGMAMGYIITKYEPKRYRNVISKKLSLLLFTLACVTAYIVATHPLSYVGLQYHHLSSALYAAYSRNLWAIATCTTIAVIEYGPVASVRGIASWHGFAVLSRLAYGVYLTHSIILQQNLYSRRNVQQFDLIYSEGMHGFGILAISVVFSLLLWLFVEAPLNNIVNLFTNSGSKKEIVNQKTKENGEGNSKMSDKIK
ncbi:O-acyltransferase like protein-like [Spodoptera frugiperda]|uniref:O-acyltransferase like protein-like n=1 Tax=Spodoptera frugiperda TaxID=7108 RepID=A0A9R0ERE9_SPOFR|nr:O-acyltransferase like protein-like [Spodoptera frugiperda]